MHVSSRDGKFRSRAQEIFPNIKGTSLQEKLATIGSDETIVMTYTYNGVCNDVFAFCTATNFLYLMYFKRLIKQHFLLIYFRVCLVKF